MHIWLGRPGLATTVNGTPVTLSPTHIITVTRQGNLHVTLSGFKPGTTATVWGFSTPTMLTTLTITPTQDGSEGFTLPASMLPGNHTLIVNGTAANGKAALMNKARHRLSRTGNRQLNAALHRMALTQAHWHPAAKEMMARRKAGGDSGMEALRVLKRRLSDVVYAALQADVPTSQPLQI